MVELSLPENINGPGTYALVGSGPLANEALYQKTKGTVTVPYFTRLVMTGPTTGYSGNGTLVVSSFDGAAHTMRGTFTYRAYTQFYSPTIRYMEVTGGTFDLRY